MGIAIADVERLADVAVGTVKLSLLELERAIWELNWGVLVDETFMQAAESFVLLTYSPVLTIEFHLDYMLSIGSMIMLILDHIRGDDLYI